MAKDPRYYALVAERNGLWMGTCKPDAPDEDKHQWLDAMFNAGATVKPVKDRLEYENWDKSVK